MTITDFSLSTPIFYTYYVLIIILLVIVSDGCETLFSSTSSVIKYHNYPDILNLSPDIYEKHDKLNRFDEAIQDYSKAIQIDPNNAYTYYNKGISLDRKGDYDKAI